MSLEVQRLEQWNDIMQMTEQLHQLSANDDWQKVVQLESERLSKLEAFFLLPVAEGEAEEIRKGLQKIIKKDSKLKLHCTQQQQHLSVNAKQISNAKQAIKAYGDFK